MREIDETIPKWPIEWVDFSRYLWLKSFGW